jgi:hypothetical protein
MLHSLTCHRGLDFTAQALRRSMENSEEELNTSFTKAYEATLRKHHNMLVRPVFSVSFNIACYPRQTN